MNNFDVTRPPDSITVAAEGQVLPMIARGDGRWRTNDVTVTVHSEAGVALIAIHAPKTPLTRLRLRWNQPAPHGTRYLGDHWERGYGDLEWRGLVPERPMPWYFLAHNERGTFGCGVKTGALALCFWTVDATGISLWLDLRCGASPVELGERTLAAATIVSCAAGSEESPFAAARRFCARLCDSPRLPSSPVYGGNNWYYAYGNSSHEEIVADSRLIAELSPSTGARPFMVIDDGWQACGHCCGGGPWTSGNSQFPDMPGLAAEMKAVGVRPGIWTRPLMTDAEMPDDVVLYRYPKSESHGAAILDPTHPDVLEIVRDDCRTIASWGFELLKFDFTTYDLLRGWGFQMGWNPTSGNWRFGDRSKTTAEAVLGLYDAIREGAGDMLLIGCNTIGHLAAGIVEIQRTGDDTSGRQWERTRKMGVNTLAFRMPQHDAFFAVDADCAGITRDIPWTLNSQWLELLAKSGTPLFVSAAPDAMSPEVRAAMQAALAIASRPHPVAEPLDWLETTCPTSWRFEDGDRAYDWTDPDNCDLSV